MDREARPAERLLRKYSEFQQRYEARPQDAGPSSPALPAVRPALAAKTDPFALSDASDAQSSRPSPTAAAPKTKSGKTKMAIFSDADAGESSQPATSGGPTKGWDSIGSIRERKKENEVEAKPWVGETLKAGGKKSGPSQKMAIFRDEVSLQFRVAYSFSDLPYIYDHRTNCWLNPMCFDCVFSPIQFHLLKKRKLPNKFRNIM
jgi:checkpoint serine/threonine-protein kinase